MELTERQQRELEYHRTFSRKLRHLLDEPFSFEVCEGGRWWNAYWRMFTYLKDKVAGKRVLVVGCGPGEDALRLARMGGKVSGFDLSEESLEIARELAKKYTLEINFQQMPAEALTYPDQSFDLIFCRDILHHVDIPACVRELRRVSAPGATWVIDEIYSHSLTDRIRHSRLVERVLYPRMQGYVYGGKDPYITEDERKMTEKDMALVVDELDISLRRYFNFLVGRILPDNSDVLGRIDTALVNASGLGRYLAGRMLVVGTVN